MWRGIHEFVISNSFGAYVSIAGLFVSIVGFIWTILVSIKSRKYAKQAADSAKATAEEVTNRLKQSDTIGDLGITVSGLDELKSLHRLENISYDLLAYKYSVMRGKLVQLRSGAVITINESEQEVVQSVIATLGMLERHVDEKINSSLEESSTEAAKRELRSLNYLLSDNLDSLHELLARVRQSGR